MGANHLTDVTNATPGPVSEPMVASTANTSMPSNKPTISPPKTALISLNAQGRPKTKPDTMNSVTCAPGSGTWLTMNVTAAAGIAIRPAILMSILYTLTAIKRKGNVLIAQSILECNHEPPRRRVRCRLPMLH